MLLRSVFENRRLAVERWLWLWLAFAVSYSVGWGNRLYFSTSVMTLLNFPLRGFACGSSADIATTTLDSPSA